MLSASFKSNVRGSDLRKLAKGIPVAARNSINKSGAVVRRQIADEVADANRVDQLTALKRRVFFFPCNLQNLNASIVVLSAPITPGVTGLRKRRERPERERYVPSKPSFYELPKGQLVDQFQEPSLDAYVDGIMEEFDLLIGGHFLKYLKSLSGLFD
jgi:hypothetical protein